MIPWRYDMQKAPKDGTQFLAYYELKGLADYWARAVPVYIDKEGKYVFASRACSGYSDEEKPIAWCPINKPHRARFKVDPKLGILRSGD